MTIPIFDYEVPYNQRLIQTTQEHQLTVAKRTELVSLRGAEASERTNNLIEGNFNDLMERTQSGLSSYCGIETAMQDVGESISGDLSDMSQNMQDGLEEINDSLFEGFAGIDSAINNGFERMDNTLNNGFNQVDGTLNRMDETLRSGFTELSFLLEDVSEEIGGMRADINEGFDQLGAIFNWGFSSLIMQAEMQNKTLNNIVEILLRPVDTEAKELFFQSRAKYRKGLMPEALESFLYLLEERKYRIILGTYFPIHIFIADIYLFEKDNFKEAVRYYKLAIRYLPAKATRLKSFLQLSLAYCYYLLGNFPGAKYFASESEKTYHSNEACYQIAHFSALIGDTDRAIVELKRVTQADKRYIFRILNERDFACMKKQIMIFLVKIRRLNALRKLREKLAKRLAEIKSEEAGFNNLNYTWSILAHWSAKTDEYISIIGGLLTNWHNTNTSAEILSGNAELTKVILEIKDVLRETKSLVDDSVQHRKRIEKKREAERQAQIVRAEILRKKQATKAEAEKRKRQKRLAQIDAKLAEVNSYIKKADERLSSIEDIISPEKAMEGVEPVLGPAMIIFGLVYMIYASWRWCYRSFIGKQAINNLLTEKEGWIKWKNDSIEFKKQLEQQKRSI